MADECTLKPLAPATNPISDAFGTRHVHRSSKWLVYVCEAMVIIIAFTLIVSTIFMRVVNPISKITSASLENVKYEISGFLRLKLTASVSIKNTNFGRFVLDNNTTTTTTTMIVLYDDVIIGHGEVTNARVKARGTENLHVPIEVSSSMVKDSEKSGNLSVEIGLGVLEMRVYAKMKGIVYLVYDFVKIRKKSEVNCTMSVNLTSKVTQGLICN